ncbi:MAG TPA: hypothetical protein VHR17_16625 [Thermoanaerobaculia bacterium]|nr:hypothetical protein [Thermoanaerobaculia bacterium]
MAIAVVFFVVGLVGILHHEMWRDEIEIWMLATDSPTLSALMTNISTQPHPPLWYLLTWFLARVTSDLRAMQLLSLAIGTGTAYLFASRAPLPLLHRALFCFGYFPLFEYTIISRSYGLDLFFSIAFCVLYAKERRRYPWLALTLALLANVHLLGTVIAGLLFLLLAWDAVALAQQHRAGWRVWGSLAAAAGGILLGLSEGLLAAARMGAEHVHRAPIDTTWIEGTLASIVNAYLPLPDIFERTFWNSSFLALVPARWAEIFTVGLAIVLFASCAAALRRSRILLALYTGGTLAMLVVFAEKSSAYMRHYGHLAILFIAMLWLSASRDARARALVGPASVTLAVVLALHVGGGAFAYGADLKYPFSRSQDASRFLAAKPELTDATLVGSIDYTAQPFAAYLGKSIYYPDQQRFGTFMTWGPEREVVRYQRVLKDAIRLHRESAKPVVLILDYNPKVGAVGDRCRADDQFEVELLAAFQCAIVSEESYWLALLRETPADGAPAKACVSHRALPVGPHVEIPRIQDAEAARRARRHARRGEAVPPAAASAPAATEGHRRQRERAARKTERAASDSAIPRQWRIAGCAAEPE